MPPSHQIYFSVDDDASTPFLVSHQTGRVGQITGACAGCAPQERVETDLLRMEHVRMSPPRVGSRITQGSLVGDWAVDFSVSCFRRWL